MNESPKRISISELHQDTAGVVHRIRTTRIPVVVTDSGHAAAVLLSAEAYEKAEQERELLGLIARGEQEIARGKGYDLDSVLKDAEALLSRE